jgi:hypothetical protein
MRKSLKSPEYERLIALLVAVRKKADIRQQALAKKLGKPQSLWPNMRAGSAASTWWNLSQSFGLLGAIR